MNGTAIDPAVLSLLATLILLGVVFYFVEKIPMAAPFPSVIRAVSIIVAVIVVLKFFGIQLLNF